MPASYKKKESAVNVEANLVFNNIIEIDELAGTATLDFKFRLYWNDERIYMPDLWPMIDPYLADQGMLLCQKTFACNTKKATTSRQWYEEGINHCHFGSLIFTLVTPLLLMFMLRFLDFILFSGKLNGLFFADNPYETK